MKLRILAFGLLAVPFFPQQLKADFIPPYDVPDPGLRAPLQNWPTTLSLGSWTLNRSSNGDFGMPYITTSASSVTIYTGSSVEHSFSTYFDIQFTHPILATGILSFDYSLALRAPGGPSSWNFGGYLLDGVLTKLPAGTGSVTLPVRAGDLFGFEAYASVNCVLCDPPLNTAGETTFTITHFVAPVPEPTTTTLLICGGGLALARLRRSGRSPSR